MNARRIQVVFTERLFPGQTLESYRGPLDEAPGQHVIRERILEAVSRGETKGEIVRNGRFAADKGSDRYAWWVADDGRDA